MSDSYSNKIACRIDEYADGTIFTGSDFTDIANKETVRRNLNRLVQAGTIRRVMNGMYEKPRYSKFLKEYVATAPEDVAKTLARCYNWTIAPDGNASLNLLGLSTQVPAIWSYVSDGPNKTFLLGKQKIAFKHRANKEITGLSEITIMVIQALKELGKENITPTTIRTLSRTLTDEDKATCLREGANATGWVYNTIKMIAKENNENEDYSKIT